MRRNLSGKAKDKQLPQTKDFINQLKEKSPSYIFFLQTQKVDYPINPLLRQEAKNYLSLFFS